jgi:hypothetical protein
MKTRNLLLATAILLAGGAFARAAGPVSRYYLTAGDQGNNWTIQALAANVFPQAHPENQGEYGIAVTSTVRTLGNGNSGTGLGSEYTLNMAFTGNTFAYPTPTSLRFYDGTSDGSSNYSVDFETGIVYRMNLNWSNATPLFNTGFGGANALGITYDPNNNSLWVSQWSGNLVRDFTLGGAALSSFNATGFNGSLSCLALDSATNTLWMGSQNAQGTFSEFSRTGTLLQTQSYATMAPENTLGGEFRIVPEPSTALSALLVASAGFFTRRSRNQR